MVSKRAKRRVGVLLLTGASITGAFLAAPQPATAGGLCATVTVYQSGAGTPVGGCIVDPGWIDNCVGASQTVGGTGAGVASCIPTPV